MSCLISIIASAQWQWIDSGGHKVYSDRAPPLNILEKNIIKRPVEGSASVVSTDAAAPAAAPESGASAPKLNGVDKELAEKKKKAEDAERAKRKAEEDRILVAKVENCARAKQAKADLDTGVRIARTNAKGEREVMDDVARVAETKRIQSIIAADCK